MPFFTSKPRGAMSKWGVSHRPTLILINRGARASLWWRGTGARVRPYPRSSLGHANALLSTLLVANMEAQVCPSLAGLLHVHAAITMCASLHVHAANGLIATFEAINFVHLPLCLLVCLQCRRYICWYAYNVGVMCYVLCLSICLWCVVDYRMIYSFMVLLL